MREDTGQSGFSLVELLIVVALIGILAALAVPNLLASRRAANEAGAIQSLRTIIAAESAYYNTTGNGTYGDLAALSNASLIDPLLGSATAAPSSRSGYIYKISGASTTNYVVGAAPGTSYSGTRNFSTDAVGVIYSDTGSPGTAPTTTSGTPIGN